MSPLRPARKAQSQNRNDDAVPEDVRATARVENAGGREGVQPMVRATARDEVAGGREGVHDELVEVHAGDRGELVEVHAKDRDELTEVHAKVRSQLVKVHAGDRDELVEVRAKAHDEPAEVHVDGHEVVHAEGREDPAVEEEDLRPEAEDLPIEVDLISKNIPSKIPQLWQYCKRPSYPRRNVTVMSLPPTILPENLSFPIHNNNH